MMIVFDEIDDWAPMLTAALAAIVPPSVPTKLKKAKPEFIEDACDLLWAQADRDAIIDSTLSWLRSETLAAYHGSRLTESEVASIRKVGLIPLDATARSVRIARALASHPQWQEASKELTTAIEHHGPGNRAGHREGQVHLTLSKAGLMNVFNHYLTHGAEFDQHVAHALLGPEGVELLSRDGDGMLLTVELAGSVALGAAHPFLNIEHIRAKGDLPNIVGTFLKAWSFRLAYPDFQSRTLEIDSGMVFHSVVPPEWIVSIEKI